MTVLWYFWYNFKYKDGQLDSGHWTWDHQSHKNVLSVHLNVQYIFSAFGWNMILLIENLSRMQFVAIAGCLAMHENIKH